MTDLVVAKFGGTSVADFDAMNRSVDVALLDANTRVVVLSASAGVTNILVAFSGRGWNPPNVSLSSMKCAKSSSIFWSVYVIPTLFVKKLNVCWKNITTHGGSRLAGQLGSLDR